MYVGVLVIPANARPGYETCGHYDVNLKSHCTNLPHTKTTIFNLLTVLCRFMLVPDAVLIGNDAVPTTTPAPTFGIPPTPSKPSIMSWTEVHGKGYSFKLSLMYACMLGC